MAEKILDLEKCLADLDASKEGLNTEEAAKRLEKYGVNALPEKKISRWKILFKSFWGPIPWMIEAAAILSAIIQHWQDFSIIVFMLVLNALIEFVQSSKAQSALEALKKSMALYAHTLRDGKWTKIPAKELVPGDVIHLTNGDIIPADAVLLEGEYLSVDQSSLTGESLPVNKKPGNPAYSGSIVKQGDMKAVVQKTGANTFFGETAKLVQTAGRVSQFQKSILAIGKFLILGSLVLSVVIIADGLHLHSKPLELIQLVLVLIVASIPVAMPAVLSVTMALGALALSKRGAIVSRLQAIEEMAGVNILCSDKTGTLTQNKLTLRDPILFSAKDAQEAILMGALASNKNSEDAIDSTIVAKAEGLSDFEQTKFIPFDPVGKKTVGYVKDGSESFVVSKGAPQVIIEMCVDSQEIKDKASGIVEELAKKGLRALAVGKGKDEKSLTLNSIITMYDPPRVDSKQTIEETKNYGIDVKMVTGDDLAIGKQISGELGLGTRMLAAADVFADTKDVNSPSHKTIELIEKAQGFARVFPEHKYGIVKTYQNLKNVVAMTGDGVNDAPALKQADVGIAVSGATDAARGAADLILTRPGLSVIVSAVNEARKIFDRMISYVTYRVAMTIDLMLFVTLSIVMTGLEPLNAMMVILLALLDDIPIMTIAYDNTKTAKNPVRWRLKKVLTVATVLGMVSVGQNFGLLHLTAKFFSAADIVHIQSMMFLQLVVGGHLLLLITRHKSWFFLKPFPSAKLFLAIVITQLVAVILCRYGILIEAIGWDAIGFVWAYCIVWMFILNIVRMAVEKAFSKGKDEERFEDVNNSVKLHDALN